MSDGIIIIWHCNGNHKHYYRLVDRIMIIYIVDGRNASGMLSFQGIWRDLKKCNT